MKAYGTLLAGDPEWSERARRFAAKVRDVSEYLAAEPLRGPLGPVARRVTYHDPCHVVHGQKIRKEPRALLAQVPGLEVVELPEADWCCGSAGTYNLVQPEMAQRLQARKVVAHSRDGRRRRGHRQPGLHHPDPPGAPGLRLARRSAPHRGSARRGVRRRGAIAERQRVRMAREKAIDLSALANREPTLVTVDKRGRPPLPPRRRHLRDRQRVPAPGREPVRRLRRGRHRRLPAPRLGVRSALRRLHDGAR